MQDFQIYDRKTWLIVCFGFFFGIVCAFLYEKNFYYTPNNVSALVCDFMYWTKKQELCITILRETILYIYYHSDWVIILFPILCVAMINPLTKKDLFSHRLIQLVGDKNVKLFRYILGGGRRLHHHTITIRWTPWIYTVDLVKIKRKNNCVLRL